MNPLAKIDIAKFREHMGLDSVKKRDWKGITGCSALELEGPDGATAVWVVVDSWYEKLRAEGGEDAVLAHTNQILASMGYAVAKAHRSDAQPRATDGSGRFRASLWRNANATAYGRLRAGLLPAR